MGEIIRVFLTFSGRGQDAVGRVWSDWVGTKVGIPTLALSAALAGCDSRPCLRYETRVASRVLIVGKALIPQVYTYRQCVERETAAKEPTP